MTRKEGDECSNENEMGVSCERAEIEEGTSGREIDRTHLPNRYWFESRSTTRYPNLSSMYLPVDVSSLTYDVSSSEAD